MNIQTVFQAGNSKVVSIPPKLLSDLKIHTGDKVTVEKTSDDTIIIKKAAPKTKAVKSQADFEKWFKTFIDENGEILDELADR
ncbi:hypothetical protein A3H89_03085 [Candidatus Amesbacteria bacterium RIFCSPLOWO2_02_FULL_48_11]|uniref:SpoVT-AbrB domain-containing protein n=5 Tax=Candidatus Amesiibacteriota TaxID=1752730 RepID=A0A1F4Z8H8_9BACT|nr:MAG: hypothetical protein UX78_C0005G0035 [Candidatus Amesbacteria bacterium GW2011_GWA2_47_11]KKU92936.1 MAG: hypothetical protein UY22_C0024G0002 [Candidatus Amesbacteria bacterium GW2011_GWC1_48_10]KKW00152.1 MAG: hypothetical protein UY33_C0015G0039 [Candidatus Amesbacteria bacterium GW2011_GWA1_48_9]OGC90891.1 MAG: hypothetical protein A2V48_01935 [Candidatus Amesbacteria bacterium RBG_19FT_COMBO_48_16]OGC96789.1 MAG: hypothetical protein A3C34_01715 [Candidatus Amesbacteria bacterium R